MIGSHINTARRTRRPAATLVEGAFVISLFLLFMFGIFEYARYLMFLHVATNAVRDSARYASVNVDKPSTFPTADYTSGTVVYPSITSYCKNRLAGIDSMLDAGYSINVFPCDPASLAQTPPVVAPLGGAIGATPWNNAAFTDRICVQLTGTYRMVLPSFLYANPTINVNITSVIGSEG
ncbi:MAG: TadE family protein [Gemmataceae bacterium]